LRTIEECGIFGFQVLSMEWMMDGKTIHLARDLEAMASFVCSCFGKRMSSANQGEIDGNRPGIAS
jgi:hypothetical protein